MPSNNTQIFAIRDQSCPKDVGMELYVKRENGELQEIPYQPMVDLAQQYSHMGSRVPYAIRRLQFTYDTYRRQDKQEETLPREILSTIMQGRVDLNVLLNTFGGQLKTAVEAGYLFHVFSKYGGECRGYVANRAASLGSILAMFTNKKYAKRDSAFLWHHGKSRLETGEYEIFKSDIMKKLYCLALGGGTHISKRSDMLDRIDAALNDPENVEGEFRFSGEELHDFGVLTQIFDTVEGVRQKCITDAGISEQISLNTINPVARFFITAELEEELIRRTGIHIGISQWDMKTGEIEYGLRLATYLPNLENLVQGNIHECLNAVMAKHGLST